MWRLLAQPRTLAPYRAKPFIHILAARASCKSAFHKYYGRVHLKKITLTASLQQNMMIDEDKRKEDDEEGGTISDDSLDDVLGTDEDDDDEDDLEKFGDVEAEKEWE